jgi:choline dehydrogenase-like flavoprotein
MAMFPEPVEAYYGAPQSVSCHHFADRGDRVGYFLETPPIHPMLAAIAFPGFGASHRRFAERLANISSTIALLVDGHHGDPGGRVRVDRSGHTKLAYELGDGLREAGVDAIKNMARVLLAAGAEEVITLHEQPISIRRESDLDAVDRVPFGALHHTLFSAHQMGGCPMGADPRTSVVDARGRHHELENLWITDGSIFPTGLGVNPQLSIYGHSRLFATEIARAG